MGEKEAFRWPEHGWAPGGTNEEQGGTAAPREGGLGARLAADRQADDALHLRKYRSFDGGDCSAPSPERLQKAFWLLLPSHRRSPAAVWEVT